MPLKQIFYLSFYNLKFFFALKRLSVQRDLGWRNDPKFNKSGYFLGLFCKPFDIMQLKEDANLKTLKFSGNDTNFVTST